MVTKTLLLLYVLVNILIPIHGVRIQIRNRDLPSLNSVALRCTEDDNVTILPISNIAFNRIVVINGQSTTESFTDFVPKDDEARFTITPEAEGIFSCTTLDTDTQSNNTVAVVATPTADPNYISPSINYAVIGSSPVLQCLFLLGILTEYYNVVWYQGSSVIDTTGVDTRYEILSNLSLLIHDVNLDDDTDGYYCELSVTIVGKLNTEMIFSEYGYDVSLIVFDDLELYSDTLYDTVIKEGSSSVLFTCITQSAPAGTIRWLINGTYITTNSPRYTTSNQINSTSSNATVTSTLTITNPEPLDSGTIECVGYIENGVDIIFESNQATLTVIGNSFVPVFQISDNNTLLLSITLSNVITQLFNIHVRYHNEQLVYDQILTDALFYNTAVVDNYRIDTDSLPFNSFTVAVAIEVNGVLGDYTVQSSEAIVLPILGTTSTSTAVTMTTTSITLSMITTTTITATQSLPSSCDCPASSSCVSTQPYIFVMICLSIVLLILIVVLITVCLICMHNRKSSNKRIKNLSYRTNEDENSHEMELCKSAYTKDCSTSTSPTHTSCSHTHSPSATGDSQSYSSGDEHDHSCTPSRPSSQETFYPDKSRTVSPMPNIYVNTAQNTASNKDISALEKEKIEKHHTTSSIAVGTSPPRDGKEIIISFMKGQSESPKRTEDRHNGVLSPARSDPSLESSLKSECSKKPFSQSVAIPKGGTRDQDTLTSPVETPIQSTYQQFQYGTNEPPVLATKEVPKKEDEKIYQKIIKEYDVV